MSTELQSNYLKIEWFFGYMDFYYTRAPVQKQVYKFCIYSYTKRFFPYSENSTFLQNQLHNVIIGEIGPKIKLTSNRNF